MSNSNLKFIDTDGGPLILMEKSLISNWNGANEVNFTSISDYDRACEIENYIGLLDINSYQALVFGGEPMMTTYFQISESLSLIVRINYTADLNQTEEYLKSLTVDFFPNKLDLEITFEFGELILFDSAYDSNSIENSLLININPGNYGVQTLFYKPNDEFSFLIHPLILKS